MLINTGIYLKILQEVWRTLRRQKKCGEGVGGSGCAFEGEYSTQDSMAANDGGLKNRNATYTEVKDFMTLSFKLINFTCL